MDPPNEKTPKGDVFSNLPLVIHGRRFLGGESVYFYHNLFVSPNRGGNFAFTLLSRNSETTSRWLLNNILVYLPTPGRGYPFRGFGGERDLPSDTVTDGNLHWCPDPEAGPRKPMLELARKQQRGEFADRYPHAWAAHSQVSEPGFIAFSPDEKAVNDYRLREDSPAVNAGVVLPDFLPDASDVPDASEPDIGPLPLGTESLKVGRFGRIDAVEVGSTDR